MTILSVAKFRASGLWGLLFLLFAFNVHAQFGIINTVAGNGTGTFGGDGGPAVLASLNNPLGVWVDVAGNIYIADQGNNRIRKVTASTGFISTIVGNGVAGYSGDGGSALLASINQPAGICFDLAGNLYIGDYGNNCIRKVTPGGIISTVAGNGTPGFAGDGGLATLAELQNPYAVWVDPAGNIYITDQGNYRVRRVDGITGIITTYAGTGVSGFCCDGGPAIAASFTNPAGICMNSAGTLFFSTQAGDARVRNVTSAGIISTEMGDGVASYSGDCGPSTAAEIEWPQGLAIDAAGNVYLATSSDYRIRVVDPVTHIIHTVAGDGTTSYSGDGGPALSAGMNPYGVYVDLSGNIFITGDNRVREVTVADNRDSVFFCEGSSAVLGGTSSFVDSFEWNTGATTSSITVTTSGTYWVRMVVCSYVTTDTFFVNVITTNVNLGPDTAICTGTPITLHSTDTYFSPVYLWNTGSTASSITVSTAGTYWLRVTDHGCAGTDTVHITTRPSPPVNLGPDISFCAGSSATLQSSDVYVSPTYLWNTGGTGASISVSTSGTYWLDVTVNGCTGSDTEVVTVKPIPVVNLGPDTTICSGTSVTLQSSVTYVLPTYLWSTLSTTSSISVSAAGTYWLDVTVNGCMGSDTVRVAVAPTPVRPVAGSNSPVCSGNELLLTATDVTGGVTYLWAGPPAFTSTLQDPVIGGVTTASGGIYTVTATLGFCSASGTEVVVIDPSPPPPVLASNAPVCSGNALDLSATDTAGAVYAWTGPAGFVSNVQNPVIDPANTTSTGIYTVIATLNGCPSIPAILMVVVDSTPVLPVVSSNSPGTPSICQGDTLELFALEPTAGVSYSWTGPGGFISGLQNPVIVPVNTSSTGTFSLTVTLGPCSAAAVTTVSITPTPGLTATSNGPVCTGSTDTLFLQAASDPGATYSWTGPYVFVENVQNPFRTPVIGEYGGIYKVTAFLNGCSTTVSDTVVVRATPAPPVMAWQNYCQYYDAPQLQAMGDSILWYATGGGNGGSLIAPIPSTLVAGTTFFYASQTLMGCTSAIDSAQITVYPKPTVTVSADTNICQGDTAVLMALDSDPQAAFKWSPALYLSDTNLATTVTHPETNMTYSVVASNIYSCTDTATEVVKVLPAGVIYLPDSASVYAGQSYQINTQSNCSAFTWFPPSGLNSAYAANPLATPQISTLYFVTAYTPDGCQAIDSINIFVIDGALLTIPNAFAPGNGPDNLFKIVDMGTAQLSYFRIFDRWGNKMFEATSISEGWDGTYKGAPQPEGVYVYEVEAVSASGAFTRHGNLTLIR